eukprot:5898510-Pleurochrysis_carterae.AAC.1
MTASKHYANATKSTLRNTFRRRTQLLVNPSTAATHIPGRLHRTSCDCAPATCTVFGRGTNPSAKLFMLLPIPLIKSFEC